MRIYLNELPPNGAVYEGDLPTAVLETGEGDPVRCEQPVHCRLRVSVVSGELRVDGTLAATLALRCRRCDTVYPGQLEALPYHYDQALDPNLEYVDLTDDLRETILLAFPLYPVCRPDCRGLCAQCGADLNAGDCECAPPADNRWAVLGGLTEIEKE